MLPVAPENMARGRNTVTRITVMPTTAPWICPMALMVASFGRQAFLGHDALDVLHHHDGVVNHDTDHQHHGEHGQNIDGQAGDQHHGKGAEQCDGHHDGRDQGVADVLQEDQHHDEHQHDGFQQRVHHLLDGDLHELGGVVGR